MRRVRRLGRRLFEVTGAEFLLDEKKAATVFGQFIGRGRPVGPIKFTVTDGGE